MKEYDFFNIFLNEHDLFIPEDCLKITYGDDEFFKTIFLERYFNFFDTIKNENDNYVVDKDSNYIYEKDSKTLIVRSFSCTDFPEGVVELEKGCSAYNESRILKLPETIKKVNFYAFYKSSVEEIYINEGCTYFNVDALAACRHLKKIYISSTLTETDGSFSKLLVSKLNSIEVSENNPTFSSLINDDCLINKKTKELIKGTKTFNNICSYLEKILKNAFYKVKFEDDVFIPKSVKIIENYGFNACIFKNLYIDAKLENVNELTFFKCKVDKVFAKHIKPSLIKNGAFVESMFKGIGDLYASGELDEEVIEDYVDLYNKQYKIYAPILLAYENGIKFVAEKFNLNDEATAFTVTKLKELKLLEFIPKILMHTKKEEFSLDALFDENDNEFEKLDPIFKYKKNKNGTISISKYIGTEKEYRLPDPNEYPIESWSLTTFNGSTCKTIIIPATYDGVEIGFTPSSDYTIIFEEGIRQISDKFIFGYKKANLVLPSTFEDFIYHKNRVFRYWNRSDNLWNGLINISISNKNSNWNLIDYNATVYSNQRLFNKKKKAIYFCYSESELPEETEILMPAALQNAFYGDKHWSFKKLENLKYIGAYNDIPIKGYGKVILPESLEIIETEAIYLDDITDFRYTQTYITLVIPSGIKEIEDNAIMQEYHQGLLIEKIEFKNNPNSNFVLKNGCLIDRRTNTIILMEDGVKVPSNITKIYNMAKSFAKEK